MSKTGADSNAWDNDYSYFWSLSTPFSVRGGNYSLKSGTGVVAFYRASGAADYYNGFRSVLIEK